jgi:hypothetical protein
MGKAQDFAQYPSESNTNKQYSTSTEFSTEKNSTQDSFSQDLDLHVYAPRWIHWLDTITTRNPVFCCMFTLCRQLGIQLEGCMNNSLLQLYS